MRGAGALVPVPLFPAGRSGEGRRKKAGRGTRRFKQRIWVVEFNPTVERKKERERKKKVGWMGRNRSGIFGLNLFLTLERHHELGGGWFVALFIY